MVFDIRGRRRHVVKAVYAILALLMFGSLFLVTGAVNIGSILGTNSSSESATSSLEKQAEAIEARLVKSPEDENLLANLTRARVSVVNAMIPTATSTSDVEAVEGQLALVSEDWSKYLAATSEPSPGLAIQTAPALFQMAELSSTSAEALENVTIATEAQEIVAEGRPSLNSYSTLAFYQLFTGDFKAAQASIKKATTYAGNKFERESIENKFEEVEKNAKEFSKAVKAEKATKSKTAGKESVENPFQGLGGTTLGE